MADQGNPQTEQLWQQAQHPSTDELYREAMSSGSLVDTINKAFVEAGPFGGIEADKFWTGSPADHILSAFGQGARQGWGDNQDSALQKEWQKEASPEAQKSNSFINKAFNSAVMRPLAAATDFVSRAPGALMGGIGAGLEQTAEEINKGVPVIGRPVGEEISGFTHLAGMELHIPFSDIDAAASRNYTLDSLRNIQREPLPDRTVQLQEARSKGVIGEGEEGYFGVTKPSEEQITEREEAAKQAGLPIPEINPETFFKRSTPDDLVSDVDRLARQVDPDTFNHIDRIHALQDDLRQQLIDFGANKTEELERQEENLVDIAKSRLPKEAPRAGFERDLEETNKTLPEVPEGHTRLWRGNRLGEEGQNPVFTNDAAGIAMPFQKSYGGKLTYIDVPTVDLDKYEAKAGAAPGAEFMVPPELARQAKVAEIQPGKERPYEDMLSPEERQKLNYLSSEIERQKKTPQPIELALRQRLLNADIELRDLIPRASEARNRVQDLLSSETTTGAQFRDFVQSQALELAIREQELYEPVMEAYRHSQNLLDSADETKVEGEGSKEDTNKEAVKPEQEVEEHQAENLKEQGEPLKGVKGGSGMLPEVEGTGEIKVRGTTQKVHAEAVALGMEEDFPELPTTTGMNMKDVAQKAIEFVKANPEGAEDILQNRAKPPGDIPAAAIWTVLKQQAMVAGDIAELRRIASAPLTSVFSRAGQELRVLSDAYQTDPVKIIQALDKLKRDAKGGLRTDADIDRTQRNIQDSVNKAINDFKPDWNSFLKSLDCQDGS